MSKIEVTPEQYRSIEKMVTKIGYVYMGLGILIGFLVGRFG